MNQDFTRLKRCVLPSANPYCTIERDSLTQAELKEHVYYDGEVMTCLKTGATGNCNQRSRNRWNVNMKVNGYWYLQHRLIWLYVYGQWPTGVIDHINGCSHDNRIDNLRDVTNKQNCNNRHPYNKDIDHIT